MHASLTCIVEDGTVPSDGTLPRVSTRQDMTWPVGYGGTVALKVQHSDGRAFDLTGCRIDLVAREHVSDPTPIMAVAAVDGDANGEATINVTDSNASQLVAGSIVR